MQNERKSNEIISQSTAFKATATTTTKETWTSEYWIVVTTTNSILAANTKVSNYK